MAADAEATLPALIEACKRLMTADDNERSRSAERSWPKRSRTRMDRARAEAAYAWDASPISTARMSAELWAQIKNEDWSLRLGERQRQRLADAAVELRQALSVHRGLGRRRCRLRRTGGGGRCALANRKHGRLSVTIQGDGDFMYAPGVWWTAAHHRIPLLAVMHNNRAYHQEVMHLQRMAGRHQRGITRAHIGTTIDRPQHRLTRRSRRAWASTRRGRSPTQAILARHQAGHRGRQARRAVAHRRRHATALAVITRATETRGKIEDVAPWLVEIKGQGKVYE